MSQANVRRVIVAGLLASGFAWGTWTARPATAQTSPATAPASPAAVPAAAAPLTASPMISTAQLAASAAAAAASPADAQVASATTQPAGNPLLGAPYTSIPYGISFRPPLNATEIHTATPDRVVEFDSEEKNWVFRATRVILRQSVPLTLHKDQFGTEQDGLLETTVKELQSSTPGAQIVRNEVINVGRVRVGMLGLLYYSIDQKPKYTQQAIIEVPDAMNRAYFSLEFTTPGKPRGTPDNVEDPGLRLAYDTFAALVDSVQLMDTAKIREDQDERLIRTRSLFANWTPARTKEALVPQQWLRLLRDGKDIGYSYIVQEVDTAGKIGGQEVIKIGNRTCTRPDANTQRDVQSWYVTTVDRRHENWTSLIRSAGADGKVTSTATEIGSSDVIDKAVALPPPENNGPGFNVKQHDSGPLGQGNLNVISERTLNVTVSTGKTHGEPRTMEPHVWYVPGAVSQILPQLLPLDTVKTYMFCTYISDTGDVRNRYVDVCPVEQVKINGRVATAVPIKDRVGLDGAITTYYYNPADHGFLGTVSDYTDEKGVKHTITILPTDPDSLRRLWERPDLSRPTVAPPTDANANEK